MNSLGFHLRLCNLVCSIVVVLCGSPGVGVLVYDLPLSLFCAFDSVVTIVVVCALCPYSRVSVVVRVLCMSVAFSWDSALELATS
jgi:hypothetical protein